MGKSARNAIVSLVILLIGINLLLFISRNFLQSLQENTPTELLSFSSIQSMVNLFNIGIMILILILIPLYLSQRSKQAENNQNIKS